MLKRFEAVKLLRSRRPLLAAGCVLLFLILMLLGFYTYARTESGGEVTFRYTFENRSYFNGLTFAIYAFYFGYLLVLPIFAATEGGTQLAGETSSRTLHLLLARPLNRSLLFRTKALVASGYVLALAAFLLGTALLLGLWLVGWGELRLYPGVLQLTDRTQQLPQGTALLRFLLAWPAAALGLWVTLAFSFLFSAWMRSPVNAVGVSVSLYLVLYVVSEIPFFRELRPYLFTSYLAYWRGLFQEHIDWTRLAADALRLAGFGFLFFGLAFRRFRRRQEA